MICVSAFLCYVSLEIKYFDYNSSLKYYPYLAVRSHLNVNSWHLKWRGEEQFGLWAVVPNGFTDLFKKIQYYTLISRADHSRDTLAAILLVIKRVRRFGQWLWYDWQRGCFQYQRSAARIQPSAKFYNEHIYCWLLKKQKRVKRFEKLSGVRIRTHNLFLINESHAITTRPRSQSYKDFTA